MKASYRYLEKVIPPDEALEELIKRVSRIAEVSEKPVWEAVNQVLAEDVTAWEDFPPRPRSAYDGYAVSSEETPGKFKVKGEAVLGRITPGFSIGPGEAAYVSTGAYLPDGADTVVPEEAVKLEGEYIVVNKKFNKWKNVDPPGSYVRKGEIILREGAVVTVPDVVGLLDVGITRVKVRRPIRVGIIATGGELFKPYDPDHATKKIRSGFVAETTSMLVEWAIREITPWTIVAEKELLPDNIEVLAWKINEIAERVDMVLVTGGTGPSEIDNFYRLYEALEPQGAELVFRGLRMRGGRPTSAMVFRGKPIVGLSGHPVSALHGFVRIVEPVLRYMAGVRRGPATNKILAVMGEEYSTAFPRLLRVALKWGSDKSVILVKLLPPEKQLSSNIVSQAEADGYLIAEARSYKPGDPVIVIAYREPG